MKAVRIELPPELHDYLTTVIKRYSGAGIDPEEGMILFHLWDFVAKRAQVVELEMPNPPAPGGLRPCSTPPQPPIQTPDGPVEGIEAVYNNDTPHC